MPARPTLHRRLGGLVAAAVAGSTLVLAGAPAQAETLTYDTTFTPVAADVIGVGSDTTEIAVKKVADAFNAQTPAPTFRLATFQAGGGGTIPLPTAAANRPNGSGAGKSLLYGASNNPDVDFARSSSGLSTAEVGANLQAFPFALDTLAMGVSNSVPSNAPASLTEKQIVGIYDGSIKNWSDVGGKPGVIAPKIPQAGSGTRSFFEGQLTAMNGGTKVTLATNVAEVQEHDDAMVKNDPNAIAPFSVGRARLLGTTITFTNQDKTTGGWSAKRAVYNVVRGADLGKPEIQALFGEKGFFCSTAARDLIAQGGLDQLASSANGGACGVATQTATTNFALNQQVVTSTTLTGTSPSAGAVTLTAAVTASTAPAGTVTFKEGETVVAANVPLTSGQAVASLTGVTAGAHTYTATFAPAGASFDPSTSAPATVTVTSASTLTVDAPRKADAGKVKVTVTVPGGTGDVTVTEGAKTLKSGMLKSGKAVLTLKLKAGKHKLVASFPGDDALAPSSRSFTIKVV
jgi:ABC-type phosphate transport system substrate-binding protein